MVFKTELVSVLGHILDTQCLRLLVHSYSEATNNTAVENDPLEANCKQVHKQLPRLQLISNVILEVQKITSYGDKLCKKNLSMVDYWTHVQLSAYSILVCLLLLLKHMLYFYHCSNSVIFFPL